MRWARSRLGFITLIGVLMLHASLSACTDSSSESAEPAAEADGGPGALVRQCEAAAKSICARACQCSPDSGCHVLVVGELSTAAGNFVDEAECLSSYSTLGCAAPDPNTNFSKCQFDTEAAQCIEGAGTRGIEFLEVCQQK